MTEIYYNNVNVTYSQENLKDKLRTLRLKWISYTEYLLSSSTAIISDFFLHNWVYSRPPILHHNL
jgi:hypothetical protein